MTEPGTGSDLQSVRTKAIRTGDEYVIDGAKTFISNGLQAEFIVVVAKTNPDDRAAGISLICVDTREVSGFSRGRVLKKIGQHGPGHRGAVLRTGVRGAGREPASATSRGSGFVQLMNQLPQERLVLGVAPRWRRSRRRCGSPVAYTKEREAFGRPVFNFQNTKFSLAEVATTAKIGRVFLDDCIAKHLQGELDVPTASMAKWWLSEQQCQVVDTCLQFFGGYGYMAEYPISRLYTDARIQKIYGGTNEIMKEIISRFL